MPDVHDMVIRSIQNYAQSLDAYPETQIALLALAEEMGTFITDDLKLTQEWAVAAFVTRGDKEFLDDVDDEDFDRDRTLRSLRQKIELDRKEVAKEFWDIGGRRGLVTRAYMEWVEDTEPVLDQDLVDLVQNEW